MLTILSIITGGGLLGGIAMLFIKPALRKVAGEAVAKVPWQGWAALLAIAVLVGGGWFINHKISAAYSDGRKIGRQEADAEWKAAFDTMHTAAMDYRRAYETASGALANAVRQNHDQTVLDNARLADALSLRGPGAAGSRCRPVGDPVMAQSPGGSEQAPATPDAPRDPVPAEDGFAIVPWGWLVDRAREHDDLLAENTAWREWYFGQRRIHDDAVARLRAAQPAFPRSN